MATNDHDDASVEHFDSEFDLDIAGDFPSSPRVEQVLEACIRQNARHVHRRLHCNMSFVSWPERRAFLENAVRCVPLADLQEMVLGDLEMLSESEKWGATARGIAAFFDEHLGIDIQIPREKLKGLDVSSPALVKDVLLLAEGARQDVGFFVEENTPQGTRRFGADELALRHLQEVLAKEPRS